jgi:hypothetical protein
MNVQMQLPSACWADTNTTAWAELFTKTHLLEDERLVAAHLGADSGCVV